MNVQKNVQQPDQKPSSTTQARLHDGSIIPIEIYGNGPQALLLPVNPTPIEGEDAETMRQYGADPALGQTLIHSVRDMVRVIAFDYEGFIRQHPKPETLTPENVVADFLSVADAAKAHHFAYYGYSWMGMVGIQFALRTTRLSTLVIGGYPPIDGPYQEMLAVTTIAYEMAESTPSPDDEWSTAGLSKAETKQYVTLYKALQGFDDEAAQAELTCNRICFVGSADEIDYTEHWGNIHVSLANPMIERQQALEEWGWQVHILDGMDHMQAMQAKHVVPILRSALADL